jgi:oxidase EvaA
MILSTTGVELTLQKSADRSDIRTWTESLLSHADFAVEDISLSESKEWIYEEGAIRHVSGKFFSVVGLKWLGNNGRVIGQPFIDQREIGTLGFMLYREPGNNEILVQAKIEPGNVNVIQLAPSVQVTDSNARQVHGGGIAPYVSNFVPGTSSVVCDSLQSEQGTRFYHKQNRNVLAVVSQKTAVSEWYRWMNVQQILNLIQTDFLFNTDFRSVMVCAPWELLVCDAPFSKHINGVGVELKESYFHSSKHIPLDSLKQEIRFQRSSNTPPGIVSLGQLSEWIFDESGPVTVNGARFNIRQIHVSTRGREVPQWDQPIIDSASVGAVILVCGRIGGVLHFLFSLCKEPGLLNGVELTATKVYAPGEKSGECFPDGTVIAECHQSEEGGRFYRDVNQFRIIDVGPSFQAPEDHYWLTLNDVKELLDEDGWFTNEARSIISLLMYWL